MVVTGGTHAGEFLRLLGNGHEYGIDRLFYAYQERPGGIAEALGLAERFVEGDRVVVMLADNVLEGSLRLAATNFLDQDKGARILLSPVEEAAHLKHLGVPELDDKGRVVQIIEKPDDPPSAFGVTGIYFYDSTVFEVIPTLTPSGRGELEITDVNNWFVSQHTMEYDVLEGFWGDAGESIDAYYMIQRLRQGARRQQVSGRLAVRLFVTGAAGFIGSNYVHHVLASSDDEVTVYDALTYAGNLANLRDVEDDRRYRFVKGDITDRAAVEEAMAGHDAVVHFAESLEAKRECRG